uniref:Uncharacterized protein n=1 Tax=Lactuca sativa TaxID=4236 RepID=A0A9R1UGM3_LACSA|nr:hypothetical protein LSAT_V11C900496280 [Lactuca sativa]
MTMKYIFSPQDPHHNDYPSTTFWNRVVDIYNRQTLQPRRKDLLYTKLRNEHAIATRFIIVFRRVMHDAENGENKNTLLENALKAYRVKTTKDFKLDGF